MLGCSCNGAMEFVGGTYPVLHYRCICGNVWAYTVGAETWEKIGFTGDYVDYE